MRGGTIIGVTAIVGLCAIFGCTKPAEKKTPASEAMAEQNAKPQSSDYKIKAAVEQAFAADPRLKKEKIQIEVKDGRVTLSGTTSSGEIRIKADEVTREVKDVFGVDTERLVASQ